MSTDPHDDPFESLVGPSVPLAPDPVFAAALRRRLEARLGPAVEPTAPEEDPMEIPTATPPTTVQAIAPATVSAPRYRAHIGGLSDDVRIDR